MNHHYVPQCYLKGFVGKNNKVCKKQLNTPHTSKIREFSTAQVAYDPDFYRLDPKWNGYDLPSDPYELEKMISRQFENSFKIQLQRILSFLVPPAFNDRYSFAETILHLKRRNMYFRQRVYTESNLKEVTKSTLERFRREDQNTLKLLAELEGIPVDQVLDIAEKMAAEITSGKDYLKNMHNFSLFKRGTDSQVIGRVCNYIAIADWKILKTSPMKPFITSDNPGFLIDSAGALKNMGFEGRFRFYLPLNTENVLLISRNDAATFGSFETEWARAALVDKINTGSLLMANNQIFGPSSHALLDVSTSPLMLRGL